MDRCPNCRARCEGRDSCRRCGMELAGLAAIEEAAERLTLLAVADLAAARPAAARERLRRALALRHEPLAELLLGFAAELARSGLHHGDAAATEAAAETPTRQ